MFFQKINDCNIIERMLVWKLPDTSSLTVKLLANFRPEQATEKAHSPEIFMAYPVE